jgi:hypothetical protein
MHPQQCRLNFVLGNYLSIANCLIYLKLHAVFKMPNYS